MSRLLIGWSEESLVPEKKVSLCGQFFERISEYVESEITVTAMAVESGSEQMILISADVVEFDSDMMALTRAKFAQMVKDVEPNQLIVSATHTHTSLTMQAKKGNIRSFDAVASILEEFLPQDKKYMELVEPDEDVITPQDAAEFVAEKIALAAKKAWENRKEACFTNEFGRAAVGMCRRVSYDDGSGQMWGDTNTANFVALEGGNDSGIELIYTFDKNKKLTGVVANIACPAQILEQRSFISADFWGRTKAILREKLGDDIYLLALGGAGGDQCPRDLVRWVEPETPIDDPNVKRPNLIKRKADPSMYDISGCNRVGKRIANEILSVYEEITDIREEGIFKHKVLELDLPLRKVTMEEYQQAVRELEYYVEKCKSKDVINFEDNARMHVYTGTIQRYRQQQFSEVVPIEMHIVRFGDVSMATNPFELFLDYGNRIKARTLSQQAFILQLTCGCLGYLPTEKAEKAGHYSAYVSSGFVGHEGGDLLVRKTIEEINQMWK